MSRRRKQQRRGGAHPRGPRGGRSGHPGAAGHGPTEGAARGPAEGRARGAGSDRRDVLRAEELLHAVARRGRTTAADARGLAAMVPVGALLDAAAPLLGARLPTLWVGGWQPAELEWHVRRTGSPLAADVLVALVAADSLTIAACDVHPAWRQQLAGLGADVTDSPRPLDPGWLRRAVVGVAPGAAAETVILLTAALGELPPIERLLPPPGRPDLPLSVAAPTVDAEALGIDPAVLEKVRALLAKAESTSFEAEAQSFTAKAHELMTRHSLEHALVAGPGAAADRPLARRVTIDDPYADAKAHLIQVIAEASRCRAVQLGGLQMSTVVGFESDVAAVEVLFTSLLVQAQTALQGLARESRPGSRERSRGFRSSFLRGFAVRIGQRLEGAGRRAVVDVDRAAGGALVPVLAARDVEVDRRMHQMFPGLRTSRPSAVADGLGWRAGASAADRADLPWERLTG